jgi:prepilin-type N-terminal cleavage/methylation domain-containing protein
MQQKPRSAARMRGFTLIEVLLAVAITSVVMVTVATTFHVMLNARDVVDDLAESTEAGPRILNLIERDLRGLWTYNVHNNAVFRGRDMDVLGRDADRMDFLTTTDSVGFVLDLQNIPRKPTVCEVGYWFKPNARYRDVFEMWRREDPMVDDDLITQGSFQLVHDRVKSFKVTYYRTLGNEALEELQWDSAVEDKLPKRIKIEFTIERKRSSRNVVNDVEIDDFESGEKSYVRHFVFDERFDNVLAASFARVPVFPPEPVEESTGEGGGPGTSGTGGGGGGGPGGRGEKPTDTRGGVPDGATTARGRPPGRGGRTTQTTGSGRGGQSGGQPPGGLPPGFDPGQFFRGGGGGAGGAGGLFGGR